MLQDERPGAGPLRRGRRGAVVVGLLVFLGIAAVPLVASLGSEDPRRSGTDSTTDDALLAVRAAVGRTAASGSYEADHEVHYTSPSVASAPTCPSSVTCRQPAGDSAFDADAHGIVNFDPYVAKSVSDTSYGPRTMYVTSTTVWLTGPGSPVPESGIPLSQFASSVEAALGPSQGALTMIGLASPGGALNLEQEAVSDATPSGTGTVDGVEVTYYDVTIDLTELADTPDLTDVQRDTIQAALPLLQRGGYRGTTERIGIGTDGYVREVTATNHFTDGSTGVRHTILSNFGCAPRITAPGRPEPEEAAAPCPPPDASTTMSPATTTSPSTTTLAPSTTAPLSSTTLGGAAQADVEAIRAVFLAWTDATPPDAVEEIVEDYASIRAAHLQGIAQHTAEDLAQYSGRVDAVRIVDATHADVEYTILHAGTPEYIRRLGHAVKLGGQWKVSRDTLCDLLAVGGVTCPPRTSTTSTASR